MLRLRELRNAYKVEAAHVYELLDEPYWAPNFEAVMGLITVEKNAANRWVLGRPKIVYRTPDRSSYLMASRPRPSKRLFCEARFRSQLAKLLLPRVLLSWPHHALRVRPRVVTPLQSGFGRSYRCASRSTRSRRWVDGHARNTKQVRRSERRGS
jgi:hypothetical protein